MSPSLERQLPGSVTAEKDPIMFETECAGSCSVIFPVVLVPARAGGPSPATPR